MHPIPLQDSKFTLDASGVAGFFGGDEAVSAMATVHVYEGRQWLGWYNSPGAYEIGKRYGQLANSRFWDGLFPGANLDPAVLFELDGLKGPEYKSFSSGTILPHTGHIGSLFTTACEEVEGVTVPGRQSRSTWVTVAELNHTPPHTMNPRRLRTYSPLFASIPIGASVITCVLCGFFEDWYSFSMILLGIVSSGFACYTIGSGKFTFSHPKPAAGAPKGDGLMFADTGIIVVKGAEAAVNAVTRGRFSLEFKSAPVYRNIGLCSMLLTLQFVAQLLLIPQGTLFGQLMFVASLGVSWMYNSYLSSLEKERVQTDILMEHVLHKPPMKKYIFGTRTTMAVFVVLVLDPADPIKTLREIIPNDTKVWKTWREMVGERIGNREKLEHDSLMIDCNFDGLAEDERKLMGDLLQDSETGYGAYLQHSGSVLNV
ncbi:hypothetical protein BJ138DRAFT_1148779 [Hygrophoropsis aurantiaca]|uniref:Uncharacterized protein n=1 Tax=Hygrophoropsis aurantiaca TaxID=72124 RepID=A0ACB8AG01_9AGAM|nr:hypothetical protein BJ138DRAFT_1148779 [Hygrophoropsis aurantiaca]